MFPQICYTLCCSGSMNLTFWMYVIYLQIFSNIVHASSRELYGYPILKAIEETPRDICEIKHDRTIT